METNWIIIIAVCVISLAIIVFVIIRNNKDKDDVVQSMDADEKLKEKFERDKDNIE